DRPHTALLEQRWCDFGDERSEGALSLCELPRESLDAPAEPRHTPVLILGFGRQPSRRAGESLPGERSQTRTRVIGRSHHQSAQLVEGGVARLHRAATLEQEQAQILTPATAAGNAQAFAAEQPPRRQSRIDQIALATPALLPARALTLVHADASTLEEANEPCAVTACALDGEGGHPQLVRPRKQAPVARGRRRDLEAVELGTKRVKRDRDVDLLVRVNADRHRPLHDLASFSSRWSTGLDRAVSGKGRTLLSGHRPVERSGGGRQVGFKAPDPPASLRVIPSPPRTLSRPSDNDGQPAKLHSIVGSGSRLAYWTGTSLRDPDRTRQSRRCREAA